MHEISWDGRDDAGHNVSSGVYLVQMEVVLESGDVFRQSRRMTLIRKHRALGRLQLSVSGDDTFGRATEADRQFRVAA